MEWILFYYNSLPDLPPSCPFFSSHLLHRDFLMCNPSNTGHYEYPKFETFSYDEGCHWRELHSFLKRPELEKYVIFYTRHTNANRDRKNKVVGYFRVGKLTKSPFGFIASDVVVLSKDQSIPISYASRGVPVSWGNSFIKEEVNRILNLLMLSAKSEISVEYYAESKSVMSMLSSRTGRKYMLETCEGCRHRLSCYWGKKPFAIRNKVLKELYERKRQC